ncbi:MAG: type II secretion system F family protein, partial [Candidatus Omnitrophota bacterium]
MLQYQYKAKTSQQKIVSGVVEADTRDKAIAQLLDLGYTPLEVVFYTPVAAKMDLEENARPGGSVKITGIPLSVLSVFTRQLGYLVDAGVTIVRAIDLLAHQTKHLRLKGLLEAMYIHVRGGGRLSVFLSQNSGVFSSIYVHMIKYGEESGKLPETLSHLADLIEANLELKKKVKAGLMYPFMILVVGAGTIFILLTFVLPKLAGIFDDFNAALPLPTRIVMGVSHVLSDYWWLIMLAIAGAVYYARRWYFSPHGRVFMDAKLLHLPLIKTFIYEVDAAHFSRGLGTLVANGVPVFIAMEYALPLVQNSVLKAELRKASAKVRAGSSLSNALKG